jgi:hypothetical protein
MSAREYIGQFPGGGRYYADETTYRREAAYHLCVLMSERSEEDYCAGWLIDCEYDIWEAGTGEGNRGCYDEQGCRDLVGMGRAIGVWWYSWWLQQPDAPARLGVGGGEWPVDLATWEAMRRIRAAMRRAERVPTWRIA